MGTEVITYSRIGKEDIRFGRGTFEVVLADGRKVVLNEVDIGAILNDATLSSPGFTGWYDVNAYGAAPGNSASVNTAAIQQAITEAVAARCGTITLRAGSYDILPLTQIPVSGQTHINWLGLGGTGANGVILNYVDAGGTALTMTNNTRYSFKNIAIVDHGTGLRALALNSLTAASNHYNFLYENVRLDGFGIGLDIGDTANLAASDGVFTNLETSNSTTAGIRVRGPATGANFSTIFHFTHWAGISNALAFLYEGPTNANNTVFKFDSCSLGQNTLDFDFRAPCFANIYGAYCEHAGTGQFLKSGSATPTLNSAVVTKIKVDSSYIAYPSTPSNVVAELNQPGNYTFDNTLLATGSLMLGGFDGGAGGRKSSLSVRHGTIVSAAAPIQYRAGSNTVWLIRHEQSGDTAEEAVNTDIDRVYLIKTTGVEYDFGTPIPWSSTVAALDAL